MFYELQLPRPWTDESEHRLFHEALQQVVLADRLGIDYAWEVEHHFLEEYSHSSAPEVFLAAAAAKDEADPPRPRDSSGDRQLQPPGADRRNDCDSRSDLGWPGRLRHR